MIWDWHDFSSGEVQRTTIFLLLIFVAVELALGYRSKFRSFDWKELRSSIIIYLLNTLAAFLLGRAFFLYYLNVAYQHRVVEPHLSPWMTFILAFVLVDFAEYVVHYLAHRVRSIWILHVVHHTPKRINFSVGFRHGVPFPFSLSWIAFGPIACLGVPPLAIMTSFTVNIIYQFYCHSELIPRMKWIEFVFCTPATHRVHHGCNPEYLNWNFGGVFTVFDRIFGTYKEEDPEVPIQYGLGRPVPENTFVLAILGWWELAAVFMNKKNPADH